MKKIIALVFASLLLVGCSSSQNPYNPYASREGEEVLNKYEGDGNDFHISKWYPSEAGQITIDEGEEVKVEYTKNVDFEYTNLYTTVMGRFADFEYINFKAKGTPGKGIAFRMYYGEKENELANVLGDDVSFSLTSEYAVHSLKVKDVYKTRMDLLRKVCIFPEIGVSGSTGTFTFSDVWFSKEMPEGSTWENPGVDTGDSSVTVNGWRTEGWTQYTLYSEGTKTGVKYSKAAEYAYIEKSMDIKEGDNGLEFKFENMKLGGLPSVTCIRFIIRADVSRYVTEDVEYPYYEYYEATAYGYDLTKEDEFQPDANGITTVRFSLADALDSIGEHHENGYRLTLMIESHPDDDAKYKRYRNGEMVIHEFSTFYDPSYKVDMYSVDEPGVYELNDIEGIEKNVTYENLQGDKYWPRIRRRIETTPSDTIRVKLHNNSTTDAVKVAIHAGIFHDERTNAQNNNFFPLWEYRGYSGEWLNDGQTLDIPANSDLVVNITKNRNDYDDENGVKAEDAIDSVLFLFDNIYGDTVKRSGNVDIVSVEVAAL